MMTFITVFTGFNWLKMLVVKINPYINKNTAETMHKSAQAALFNRATKSSFCGGFLSLSIPVIIHLTLYFSWVVLCALNLFLRARLRINLASLNPAGLVLNL